ncbi:MAG: hypothetical protein HPY66_2179 [Firmicutes bacterium]|nr:hypothetical protein [Bacillota bacterium]MDI6707199.1 hypothetical protein [Bacillota bacterium]
MDRYLIEEIIVSSDGHLLKLQQRIDNPKGKEIQKKIINSKGQTIKIINPKDFLAELTTRQFENKFGIGKVSRQK